VPPGRAPTFGTALQVLDLSRSGLAALPPTAAGLTRLAELRLRGVTAYPGTGFAWASLAAVGASLRRLDVSGCHLEALPVTALAVLPHLTQLVAQDCGLAAFDVPTAAALPPGLAVLALDKNRLPYLPASALARLPNLAVVTLTDNLAMQLPPDLGALAGLAHLATLDARKVSRGLCGARPWTARSMWHLARACAALEASVPARDWAGVLLL
jgi:Leucine-rich repeat (LRR) protein